MSNLVPNFDLASAIPESPVKVAPSSVNTNDVEKDLFERFFKQFASVRSGNIHHNCNFNKIVEKEKPRRRVRVIKSDSESSQEL